MATTAEQLKSNPKMAQIKIKGQIKSGKRKSTYKVRDGDSWASIAGQAYADLYDGDVAQAQRQFAELARANANIKYLRPGQTIKIPRLRYATPNISPGTFAAFQGSSQNGTEATFPGQGAVSGANTSNVSQSATNAPQVANYQYGTQNVPGNPNAANYTSTPAPQATSNIPAWQNTISNYQSQSLPMTNVPGNPNAANYYKTPTGQQKSGGTPPTVVPGTTRGGTVGGSNQNIPGNPNAPGYTNTPTPTAPGPGNKTSVPAYNYPWQTQHMRPWEARPVELLAAGQTPYMIPAQDVSDYNLNPITLEAAGYRWNEALNVWVRYEPVNTASAYASNPYFGGGWYAGGGRGGGGGGGGGRSGTNPGYAGRGSANEIGPISWRI